MSMTTGGANVKRGYTFDPECARTTYRYQHTLGALAAVGITPTIAHSDWTVVDFGRVIHACDYRCKTSWPEWVTDEMFDNAYRLADAAQTARGTFNRRGR